ncbi:SGNH/GDSL hydrolase family protein [Pseudobacter ginsenosidimutans]|uniref:Lysophospholipase L1-like esterase n=1 Tax=Pseudobacter ginsenosidimutans TaxID=661488 RepID=A0A4Q7MUZ0_9BACT|nr:SGNH/GDSL hydrolase family protein [Pseudobacter ginsenosidimutans]QEC40555.1 SGNH/GDSL hydrolase family protein [Pseudobacter ginsenosidimutans]RZS72732.1 lysophospholipase L1-like esterase [Pseudobacter ginsenosidimutans]
MLRKYFFLAGSLSIISTVVSAQSPSLVFPDGAKVCFVGNSITQAGEYLHYIRGFYATRYPEQKVEFINCGISGDVTGGILARMQPDIMVHKPDYAVIMIGMNDVNRPLYAARFNGIDSIQQKKKMALAIYKDNLSQIVKYFVDHKVKVILQKPSIYDQTAKLPQENLNGVNDALATCAGYMQELADKYRLRTVDYWSIMTAINRKMQATDSSFTIVGKDRVHPASPGHFTMAYQFLHSTLGAIPANIISLNYGSKKVVATHGARVTDLSFSKNEIHFTHQPASLPYIMFSAATPALDLVPFTKEFNTELLKVAGLPEGNYRLVLNDSIAGEFSSAQFSEGINIALLNTPQSRQAKEVLEYCLKMKSIESDLRQLRHMEYRTLFKLPNGNIKDSGIAILQRKLADTATKKNERPPAERYLKNKPKEEDLYKEWDRMQQRLYEINKPEAVRVKIEKI